MAPKLLSERQFQELGPREEVGYLDYWLDIPEEEKRLRGQAAPLSWTVGAAGVVVIWGSVLENSV